MFLWLCSSLTNYQTSLLVNHGRKSIGDGGEDEGEATLSKWERTDNGPLCLLPLPHSIPDTLGRGRAGVSSQPSEDRACDSTVHVKEGLIVFGNVLFIGSLFSDVCRQNKFVRRDNAERAHLPYLLGPLLWKGKKMVKFTALCANVLLSHPGRFWSGKSGFQNHWITSPNSLFIFFHFCGSRKGWKRTEQHNVMYLIWQAIDTVSTGVRRFVFCSCAPQPSRLWCIFMFDSFRSALPNYKLTGTCKQKSPELQCSLLIGQSFGICHPARWEILRGLQGVEVGGQAK